MTEKEELLEREDIRNLILEAAGEEGLKIAKNLPTDHKLSEFKLAEELGMEVNDVRSILYKLYNENFVSYDKRRDEEKGWYIYHWKLLKENLVRNKEENRRRKMKELEERKEHLKRNEFFRCPECAAEYKFADALENNFLCERCDSHLERKEKEEEIKKIEKKIGKLKGSD